LEYIYLLLVDECLQSPFAKHMRNDFTEQILNWHEKNPRPMPWKGVTDPYIVWVSEILLQQTRVKQGQPYFDRFIEKYPNLQSLADTNEDELMALWKGLGYYARARNMLKTARLLSRDHGGVFPEDYHALLKLPGIGPYTAAAIASFAFGLPRAAVDGNVERVLTRFYGIEEPLHTSRAKKRIQQIADAHIPVSLPGKYNQAIMNFGAMQCTPAFPLCEKCPVSQSCVANQKNIVHQVPVKKQRIEKKKRHFHYMLVTIDESLVLLKRTNDDIWKSLYEPLLIETDTQGSFLNKRKQINALKSWLNFDTPPEWGQTSKKKQLLTHQEIHAYFYHARFMHQEVSLNVPGILVKPENLPNFALPRVVDWFLTEISITLEN
jgi:A/G-specific adenine glycosylase